MRVEQLYLSMVIPVMKEFKICEIYVYELKKFDQELAESMNQKNIYAALDLPDFKHIKEAKLEANIIMLACRKLGIGTEVNLLKDKGLKILNIDGEKYQLIFFPSGTVPEVDLKLEKTIYFMYQPKFEKIYYCGKLDLKKLTQTTINNFYLNHCYNETKKFIDFKNLVQ